MTYENISIHNYPPGETDYLGGYHETTPSLPGQPLSKSETDRSRDAESCHQYHVFRYWKEQIICIFLSGGVVGAMIAILLRFDGQPVPQWGLSINLNTVLALLSTGLRGLVIAVLSQIISQAKWQWFGGRKDRPLRHLQDFDDGSRGTLGAVRLLRTAVHGNLFACAAAFLILCSFAISPFVQQAIKTTECESPIGDDAYIQYAHYVPRQGGYVRGVSEWAPADPDTNVMICSSLTAPSGIENQIHPTCTTGNCSFPYGDPIIGASSESNGRSTSLYSTVGMCHICEDITQLAVSDIAGQYILPNGQGIVANRSDGFVLNVTTSPDLTWVRDQTSSQLSVASRWSFANLTVLASSTTISAAQNNTQQNAVIASTCVLYPCLRTYTTSIDNGELLENPVSLALMYPNFSDPEASQYNGRTNDVSDYANVFLPCNVNGIMYTKDNATAAPDSTQISICETGHSGECRMKTLTAPEPCVYRHSAKFGSAVSQVMQDNYVTGGCNVTSGALNCRTKSSGEGPGRDKFLESLYSRVDVLDPWSGNATTESIDAYFGRFATAMTNGYRTRFGSSEYDADKVRNNVALPPGAASGVVWRTTVCASIELQWMILPAAMVVLTASLLGWGLRQSWRARRTQPVWKDSVLPLLFYQELLQPADHLAAEEEPGQVLMEVNDLEKLAKEYQLFSIGLGICETERNDYYLCEK